MESIGGLFVLMSVGQRFEDDSELRCVFPYQQSVTSLFSLISTPGVVLLLSGTNNPKTLA